MVSKSELNLGKADMRVVVIESVHAFRPGKREAVLIICRILGRRAATS